MSSPSRARHPWYHPLALLKRMLLYLFLIYVGFCLFLYCVQGRLTYPGSTVTIPTEEAAAHAREAGLIPWPQPTPGAASPQGFVRRDFADPAPRGTIVFFHGNGEYAWQRPDFVAAWKQRGFRSFLYEYPGFGGRPGRPSEKAIVPDAQTLIRSLEQAGFGPIYVWGASLGCGVASAVCADPTLPVHGLALMMPWDNIANVGLTLYPYIPVRQLMTDKYDSIANLQHFAHPICVLRGNLDTVIPERLTLNLFAHLPEPKKLILQSGYGHGDWPSTANLAWWDETLDFIAPRKP